MMVGVGRGFTVIVMEDETPLPQLFDPETEMTPVLAPSSTVTVMELVLKPFVMTKSAGTVQSYPVAPLMALTV